MTRSRRDHRGTIGLAAALPLLLSQAACAEPGGTYEGKVTYADGRPIAGVEVDISGINAQAQTVGSSTTTDASGRYALHMGPGRYHPTNVIYKVNYNGRQYWVDFDQVTGPRTDAPARGRTQCDFVLRTNGPRAADIDPKDAGGYFGASLSVALNPGPMAITGWPAGSQVSLALTPAGPLLDGSPGRPLRLQQPVTDPVFRDIPVGRYSMAVTWIRPDGVAVPMNVVQAGRPTANAVLDFPPHFGVRAPNYGPNAEPATVWVQP